MSASSSSLRVLCQADLLAALASIPVPSFALETSSAEFIAADQRFEDLLGYSWSDLSEMRGDSIRPHEDVPAFRKGLMAQTPKGFLAARFVKRDGTMLAARLHYHRFECLTLDGGRVDARMVVVEFWSEFESKG